jgi:ParB/Sulfiredoxin domain
MKLEHIPLDQIVWSPWRDKTLFPIDADHINSLRNSMNQHGFFETVKARRRKDGKIELGCGHHRFEAARKAKLDSIPLFIADMDDDDMLHLMVAENAHQFGANAGAILNEVAAVMRRLIELLLAPDGFAPIAAKPFEGKLGYQQARGKLIARLHDPNKDGGIGWQSIMRYLGGGDEEKCRRSKRQIIDALSTLKQSGRYDAIVDEALRKNPIPVADKPLAKGTTVATTQQATPRKRLLDERTASVFTNDHQFQAFRDAVTTQAAQKAIPVDQQYALAKAIMKPPSPVEKNEEGRVPFSGATNKKQIGAPYIKMRVQTVIQDSLKKQRDINQKERELYLSEQREARIEAELHSANASLRSLISAIARLNEMADEFPSHPKLGGFSAKLDTLVDAIQQFSAKLDPRRKKARA